MPVPGKQPLPVMHFLSPHESDNPLTAIAEVFDFADIEDIRSMLWQWLRTTATSGYDKQLNRIERTAIFDLYEKMLKLAEAAYLLQAQSMHTTDTRAQQAKK